MIGYLSGKYLAAEDNSILVEVSGVGYSVLVSNRLAGSLMPGAHVEIFVHTNVRENAIELFGFGTAWEKKIFQVLTSVSGVGPRSALSMLGGLDAETILSAIVREDRATLTSVSGVGKKTAEHLITDLGEKARKLLLERPRASGAQTAATTATPLSPLPEDTKKTSSRKSKIPAQGASASPGYSLDIADLWNEAVAALSNLGYREGDAIVAIKAASTRMSEAGDAPSLEKLIRSSLQLLSRGMMS